MDDISMRFMRTKSVNLKLPSAQDVLEGVIRGSCAVIFTGMTILEACCAVIYFAAGGWYILGGLFFTACTVLFGAFLIMTLTGSWF